MQDQDSNEHNWPGLPSKAVVGISILNVIRALGEVYMPYPLDAPELSIRSEPGPAILRMEVEVVVDQEVVDWLQSVAGEQSDPLALLRIVQIAQDIVRRGVSDNETLVCMNCGRRVRVDEMYTVDACSEECQDEISKRPSVMEEFDDS